MDTAKAFPFRRPVSVRFLGPASLKRDPALALEIGYGPRAWVSKNLKSEKLHVIFDPFTVCYHGILRGVRVGKTQRHAAKHDFVVIDRKVFTDDLVILGERNLWACV